MSNRIKNAMTAFALGIFLAAALPAQSIYGTLTGIVSDPTQAVIAGANIKLENQASGVRRDTTTNGEGYYTFVSVPPGTYRLIVTTNGFDTLRQSDIRILGGDKMNVNVTLKVGNTSNTVEVSGDVDLVVPVDSGEKADRLTTKELENFIQLGPNAAEFIKIMPGFGISNGTSNYADYNGQTVGINGNGGGGNQSPLNGAYSYNGLPGNSLDVVADGAHVSDPGCNCATPVNPNSNMISEMKITMSNFNAESQKGPGVISSVAKGGGKDFHGAAFFDARNAVLNANDWLSNYSRIAKPENAYYYPGFNIGGPLLLPKTNFNRNRDKLFFFTGFQYFNQTLDTGLLRATVPTAGERNGDFSPAELAKLGAHMRCSGAALAPQAAKPRAPHAEPHASAEKLRAQGCLGPGASLWARPLGLRCSARRVKSSACKACRSVRKARGFAVRPNDLARRAGQLGGPSAVLGVPLKRLCAPLRRSARLRTPAPARPPA